jgi:hypothetical protein
MHQSIEVRVLASCTSDYKPIVLQLFGMAHTRVLFKKSFKVEASWMHDEEYNEVVNCAWKGDDGLGDGLVTQKLAWCQRKLTAWSFRKFRKADKELDKKTKALEKLQQQEGADNWGEIKKLQGEIESILEQEDIKWKQRAKQNWYQSGDRNTPFFHAWADHRRKINIIKKIKAGDGTILKDIKEISKAFVDFYQELFTVGPMQGVDTCLADME